MKLSTLKQLAVIGLIFLGFTSSAQVYANPAFARENNATCALCHAAYPRLNTFGKAFLANNLRMPDWKEKIGTDTGDDMLVLPKTAPLAFRVTMNAQAREAKAVNSTGAVTQDGQLDFQGPFLLKMLSGAPVTDHVSYYFTTILAEKGQNGTFTVDDAWVNYADILSTGVSLTVGQFQIGDLMFPRETRLTVQDFIPYRMAGITYERGGYASREFGPVDIAIGAVNGNGNSSAAAVNSGGYKRPDRTFDNNTNKRMFGHAGYNLGPMHIGAFGLSGLSPTLTDEMQWGIDISADYNDRLFLFAQWLDISWKDMPATGKDGHWNTGFVGADFVQSERWVYSLLYNYGDAGDFKNSGTEYEGIDLSSLTLAVSYYTARNVKLIAEATYDLLESDGTKDGIGHDTKEGYLLVGIDFAL